MEEPRYPRNRRLEWAPGPAWNFFRVEQFLAASLDRKTTEWLSIPQTKSLQRLRYIGPSDSHGDDEIAIIIVSIFTCWLDSLTKSALTYRLHILLQTQTTHIVTHTDYTYWYTQTTYIAKRTQTTHIAKRTQTTHIAKHTQTTYIAQNTLTHETNKKRKSKQKTNVQHRWLN